MKKRWFQKKNRFGKNAPKTWLKFDNLWNNFLANSVQSKNAMGPPSKCTLDNIFLHTLFNTLFCHSFHNINNLQFLISLNVFYSLDFSFFSKTIFLASVCFFIKMLKCWVLLSWSSFVIFLVRNYINISIL